MRARAAQFLTSKPYRSLHRLTQHTTGPILLSVRHGHHQQTLQALQAPHHGVKLGLDNPTPGWPHRNCSSSASAHLS